MEKIKSFLKKILHPKMFFHLKNQMKLNFDEIKLISQFFKEKNGVMFDVGSHDGSSFMPFLLKGWEIFAFEPDKQNNKKITEYISKWNLKVNLIDKAVSNVEETQTFYTSKSFSGTPSLLKFDNNQVASHEVTSIMLKNFIKSYNIKKIDFLKIDIEGYDFMAIKGFDFTNFKPRIIMCEFEDKKTVLLGYKTKDMVEYLLDKGYLIIYSIWNPIQQYGIKHDWRKMSTDINEISSNEWGNLIAFANEIDYNEFKEKHTD